MYSILLLSLMARCLETDRCVYMVHDCFHVNCSDCVGVCGNVCCVACIVLSLGVVNYIGWLCRGCDGMLCFLSEL